MSHRQRMLATLRGESTDRIPWAPRLDLWYNARRCTGTLPHPYRRASLTDIIDDLGWGAHAVIPHFKDLRSSEDDLHRGLGIYNLHSMPYFTCLHNVKVHSCVEGDLTRVTYETPLGSLRTSVLYDVGMRNAGISITHITEHAIKEARDYEIAGYIFENAEVLPNPGGFAAFRDAIGERGIAVGYLALAASPMHLLQRELMPMEKFFYEMVDHPVELNRCAERIATYYQRIFDAVADCPADAFLLGANYDTGVTPPPFFRQHIMPWLRRCAETLHSRGKLLLTHTDGENTGLLDLYLESGFDIADSVCPSPMTRLSLRQVREHFGGRISIMGGIPSVALLPHTVPDHAFNAYLDQFFQDLERGDHIILGVSDSTPPQAELSRLVAIYEAIIQFGPVTSESRPSSARARTSVSPAAPELPRSHASDR